jgi:2-succinyl-5-enolpyruvyl-6-hydroxy-3-cyclohexene-1-carboxylate synthase
LNICLEEPSGSLLKGLPALAAEPVITVPALRVFESPVVVEDFFGSTPLDRCLVIVGPVAPGQGGAVAEIVERADCPVVAEAISNLPYSECLARRLVPASDVQLGKIDKILRIGGIPTCRLWRDLEKNVLVEVAHLTDLPFTGLARSSQILGGLPPFEVYKGRDDDQAAGQIGLSTSGWERELAVRTGEFPDSEVAMLQALATLIPRGALVFLGNSLPIREWNTIFPLGKHRCFANRGANGIDGNLSTFLGLAARDEPEAWAIIGDLTALYDLAACFVLSQMGFSGRLRIVVVNNGGGKIFSRLPALEDDSTGSGSSGRLLVENRHEADFSAMAGLWRIAYRRMASTVALQDIGEGAVELWELLPDPVQSEAYWQSRV